MVLGRKMAVALGLQDCGAGVDDVMRDGVGGEAGARCVRTRTNAAGFDAWYRRSKAHQVQEHELINAEQRMKLQNCARVVTEADAR